MFALLWQGSASGFLSAARTLWLSFITRAAFTLSPKPNVFGKLGALAKSAIFARAVIYKSYPKFYILHFTFYIPKAPP